MAQDQQEYKLRIEALYAQCDELKSSMAKVRSQIMDRAAAAGMSKHISKRLAEQSP